MVFCSAKNLWIFYSSKQINIGEEKAKSLVAMIKKLHGLVNSSKHAIERRGYSTNDRECWVYSEEKIFILNNANITLDSSILRQNAEI